ncbi:GAD-like domain-containing protein [Xenorhabdus khoisanae]|uniref:GAD-like domain-containing protein n=1 Tax=Xenorhabdus khoisanae TaxID=880157 RepID=UPI0023584FF5|nr:GAD-like domain-containing protein [Xenorhabdus khoisanae]MDC9615703.1 GAD-like domain-containing protein [Xenorhabdus khoisanae]
MRDEDFECFIEDLGEATQHRAVPTEAIEKWQGRLPERLLHYWKTEGWNSYQDGLFSIVDPDDYEDIVDMWLEDTPFESMDAYHVIARSGFGKLYLCGEQTGINLTISCIFNTITFSKRRAYKKNQQDLNEEISSFFGIKSADNFDLKGSGNTGIFPRLVKKYGPLDENEIFGFEPAIVLGGEIKLENVRKLDMHIQLDILRQFADPDIQEI